MQDYMTIPLDLYTRYFLAGLLVGTGKRDSFAASVTLSRFPVPATSFAGSVARSHFAVPTTSEPGRRLVVFHITN